MIPYGKQSIDEDDINAVIEVLKSPYLTQGPEIEKFEKNIANYVGSKYAVAVSSGTAALHMCATVLNVSKSKSMLTTPVSFVATANCGSYLDADVYFGNIDSNINLSVDSISKALEEKSDIGVVIPVHFGGAPCDMEDIFNKFYPRVNIIEDAAHALGASYKCGNKVGSCVYSDLTIFSLHPVKPISAGEGGVITTNSESLYRKLLRLRSHGINKLDDKFININNAYTNEVANPWYYEMVDLGFHYRITDIQAALANSQLNKLDQFINKRRKIAEKYDKAFKDNEFINLIQLNARRQSGHHLYIILIKFEKLNISRAEMMSMLREMGIGTQVHYVPIYMQPYYQDRNCLLKSINYDNVEVYYSECISIPIYPLLSNFEQDYVIDSITTLINKYKI
jgi:UDP-4-amino-4,6-dideoxy-N-acetyl-beta-L-altrosamine transaminase